MMQPNKMTTFVTVSSRGNTLDGPYGTVEEAHQAIEQRQGSYWDDSNDVTVHARTEVRDPWAIAFGSPS